MQLTGLAEHLKKQQQEAAELAALRAHELAQMSLANAR